MGSQLVIHQPPKLVLLGPEDRASMGDQNEVQIAPGILEGTQPGRHAVSVS